MMRLWEPFAGVVYTMPATAGPTPSGRSTTTTTWRCWATRSRRTSGAHDAGDVLADTMLVAWRRLDEVPGGDTTRLWLYGVARKVLANRRRGDGRRDRLVERLAAQVDAAVSDQSRGRRRSPDRAGGPRSPRRAGP